MQTVLPSLLQSTYERLQETHGQLKGPVWDKMLGLWVVADPSLVSRVLLSDDFDVREHHKDFAAIQQSRNVELGATLRLAQGTALSNNGARHRELKLEAVKHVQQNANAALESFSASLNELLPDLLETRERFDLVADFILPLSMRLIASLSGVPLENLTGRMGASQCLTQLLSVKKEAFSTPRLMAIEQRLRKADRENDAGVNTPLHKFISMANLEVLKSGLAISLISVLNSNAEKPLCEMEISPQMVATCIPFIERDCKRDSEIGGTTIKQTEKVILYLGGFGPMSDEQKKLIFGTGAHICVGKFVTERAWSLLREALLQRRERLRVGNVRFRDFDFALIAPESAEVEVMH
jgi:cytochrome P450